MATRAFSPARTQRSYSATKSSLAIFSSVGDDCCGGRLAHAPSRTMLAHVGLAQESWGSAGRVENCCRVSRPLSDLPSTPGGGEAGRRGEGRTGVGPACLHLPSNPTEGEAGRRGEGRPADRTAAPSARGGGLLHEGGGYGKLTSPGIWGVCIERCGFGNLPRTVRQH
jgi:hypothetical protein